jgi:hypothetical protein
MRLSLPLSTFIVTNSGPCGRSAYPLPRQFNSVPATARAPSLRLDYGGKTGPMNARQNLHASVLLAITALRRQHYVAQRFGVYGKLMVSARRENGMTSLSLAGLGG